MAKNLFFGKRYGNYSPNPIFDAENGTALGFVVAQTVRLLQTLTFRRVVHREERYLNFVLPPSENLQNDLNEIRH